MNKNIIECFYPEFAFGGYTDIDGTLTFYSRIHSLIKPDSTLIDFGCGRGAYTDDALPIRQDIRIFNNKVKKVIGLDIDVAAKKNKYINEFHLLDSEKWPLEDNSADICISDNVIEHLKQPEIFFQEAKRVLKPGGYLALRTPNLLNYISLAAKMIPEKLHNKILKKAQNERKDEDVFPAYYKANTTFKIKKLLKANNFNGIVYGFESEPSYLSFSKIAYFLGVLHQKFAPKIFKPSLFVFAKIEK